MQRTSILLKSLFACLIFVFSTISANAQTCNIILGRPTNNSITASVMTAPNYSYFAEFGIQTGNYTNKTDTFHQISIYPTEIELVALTPNTSYVYRVCFWKTGSSNKQYTPEFKFRTQRDTGESFVFTIESDEHLYDKKGVRSLYQICLANQQKDNPDFMMSLGDIFGDDHYPFTITPAEIDSLHRDYRPYLGSIAHSIPFYVCLGNHEGEMDYYLNYKPGDNLAHYGTLYRKLYYPNPYPNNFYSGNTLKESFGIEYPENYYAWTWGDALFVVLDVYRDQCDTSAKPGGWAWTLGPPQYNWFKNVLENNSSKHKFVFAHHISGQGRGGINQAKLYEWGGKDSKGNSVFANKRPGWSKPIHQLMVDNGVDIFFQGHDHVFARELLDGIVYQALPMPSDSTYEIGKLANADAYTQDTLGGSGHLRVQVTNQCVTVDFVQAYLPKDTFNLQQKNRQIAFSYTLGNCSTASIKPMNSSRLKLYPNPADENLLLVFDQPEPQCLVRIVDLMGRNQLELINSTQLSIDQLSPGQYFIECITPTKTYKTKFIKL